MKTGNISFKDALALFSIRQGMKTLKEKEKIVRDRIASCFDDEQVTEIVNIRGMEVNKYFTGLSSKILDEAKVFELAKAKKIKNMVIRKIEVVEVKGLELALLQGKITMEEYDSLFLPATPVMNIKVTDKREVLKKVVNVDTTA